MTPVKYNAIDNEAVWGKSVSKAIIKKNIWKVKLGMHEKSHIKAVMVFWRIQIAQNQPGPTSILRPFSKYEISILKAFYLYNGNPFIGKAASLYLDAALHLF